MRRPPSGWKPSKEDLARATTRRVPDVIGPGLRVLFVGINPGLYSAAVGRHFARPGNRFWPALEGSGFTSRRFSPFEDDRLLELGMGITNVVARTTAAADELLPRELVRGAKRLEAKARTFRPRVVAVLGVTAYRAAFARPRAELGLQPERLGAAALWVLPNPSGLNAHYSLGDLVGRFAALRAHVAG